MQFQIQNMTCGGCARSVTKAILSVDPAAQVTANPASRRVEVASQAPRNHLVAALTEAGYAPV